MCVMWTRATVAGQAIRRRSAAARLRAPPLRRRAPVAADPLPDRLARTPPPAGRSARSSSPPAGVRSRRSLRSSVLLPVHGPLELLLVHPRAPLDVQLFRLVVELVARAALGPIGTRALSPTLTGRQPILG